MKKKILLYYGAVGEVGGVDPDVQPGALHGDLYDLLAVVVQLRALLLVDPHLLQLLVEHN